MPSELPIVLLTRPAAQSRQFRDQLGDLDVVISPIIEIRPTGTTVNLDGYDLLVFASQNAVTAVKHLDLAGRRAVVVGERTAKAAAREGMEISVAGGDAKSLIARVIAENPKGKALFLRGEHSRGKVVENLNSHGIDTDFAIVYQQVPLGLTARATKALTDDRPVVIPLFSPRSSSLMGAEARRIAASAPTVLVGMSQAVLDGWDGPAPVGARVASAPTGAAMRDEILQSVRNWP